MRVHSDSRYSVFAFRGSFPPLPQTGHRSWRDQYGTMAHSMRNVVAEQLQSNQHTELMVFRQKVPESIGNCLLWSSGYLHSQRGSRPWRLVPHTYSAYRAYQSWPRATPKRQPDSSQPLHLAGTRSDHHHTRTYYVLSQLHCSALNCTSQPPGPPSHERTRRLSHNESQTSLQVQRGPGPHHIMPLQFERAKGIAAPWAEMAVKPEKPGGGLFGGGVGVE